MLAGLAGAVTAYESLISFPHLEKLYSDAERNLEVAAIDWEGPAALVDDEVVRVEEVFTRERSQWGQLAVKSAEATRQGPPSPSPPAPPPA